MRRGSTGSKSEFINLNTLTISLTIGDEPIFNVSSDIIFTLGIPDSGLAICCNK